jgi:hypothetical protein
VQLSTKLRIYKTRVYSDLCEDVPGLLDAALVCEHCPDPVGRPDVPRVVLQHILEVVDGSILILSLLEYNESVLWIRIRRILMFLGQVHVWYRYGSGSRTFYHEAKIVRKTLISTVGLLYGFFYQYVFGPPGSASVRQRYGSEDPDPHPDLY